MRRNILLGLAAFLLVVGLSIGVWRIASAPTVLRVAVGPAASEDARLIAAAGQYLAREHESIRLKIVPTEGETESSATLDEGKADLAVVRTDAGLPDKGQIVAIMHRDVVVLATLASRGIASIPDLRGRTVGIVKRMPANQQLLEVLLAHYEVPRDSVRSVVLDGPEQVEAALRAGQIDAVLAVGTVTGRTVSGTVAAVTAASDGLGPYFLPVSEVEAISGPSPYHESFDIVRGAFGGNPPRPVESVKALGVNHVLFAATTLPDGRISELTKLLFTLRPVIARDVPLANNIEAPDLERGPSTLTVHPGASAYYENEVETFFDRYSDWIYLVLFGLSILGSGLAALLSRAAAGRRARALTFLDRLLEIVRSARTASTDDELETLEGEVDDILQLALRQAGRGTLDDAGVSAFTLGLDQARHAIGIRRALLTETRLALRVAAE